MRNLNLAVKYLLTQVEKKSRPNLYMLTEMSRSPLQLRLKKLSKIHRKNLNSRLIRSKCSSLKLSSRDRSKIDRSKIDRLDKCSKRPLSQVKSPCFPNNLIASFPKMLHQPKGKNQAITTIEVSSIKIDFNPRLNLSLNLSLNLRFKLNNTSKEQAPETRKMFVKCQINGLQYMETPAAANKSPLLQELSKEASVN